MNYKKTWFGWLNFTVGTIFMSVFIFTLLVSLFEFNGLTMFLFDMAWLKASFVAAASAIILVAGLLFIIHYLKKKLPISDGFSEGGFSSFIYFFMFILVLAAGLYLRYSALQEFNANSLTNQAYYIKTLNFFEGNTSGVTDLFVLAFGYVYSFLFKVFGINGKVLVIAGYVFEVLGSILLSIAVRHSFGKSASLFCLSLLMLLTGPVNYAAVISPDSLIFFVVCFVVFLFSLIIKDREDGLMRSNWNIILFVFFGLVFGFMIFINPIFITIPLFYVCRILLLEHNEKQNNAAINGKLLPSLVVIFSSVLSAVICIVVNMLLYGNTIDECINDYFSKIGYSGYLRLFYPDELIIVCLIIFAFCFTAYINFIFSKKDNISALTWLFICLYFVYAKHMIAFDISLYLIALLGSLAGVGLKSVIFEGYTQKNPIENNDASEDEETAEGEWEFAAFSSKENESMTEEDNAIRPENEDKDIIEETESDSTVPDNTEDDNIESEEIETSKDNEKVNSDVIDSDNQENDSDNIKEKFVNPDIVSSDFEEVAQKIAADNESGEDIEGSETEDCIFLNSELSSDEIAEDDFVADSSNTTEVIDNAEKTETVSETETASVQTEEDISEDKTNGSESKKFAPIPNILPIPKPHKRKEIGYAFEPGEKYMKYDYEIDEDDDFDIP